MNSAISSATHPARLEFVFYIDDDDNSYRNTDFGNSIVIRGPRIVLSEMWNTCWKAATGPYYFHMGDDIIFRTPAWDSKFIATFQAFPDKIIFAHANDGGPRGKEFGTHGMIHKNWCDTVGYFVPPHFSSDWNDAWLNDIANELGRRVYVDALTEHMHFVWGKGPLDQTHQERLERHAQDDCDGIYRRTAPERERDRQLLQTFIDAYPQMDDSDFDSEGTPGTVLGTGS